MTQPESAILQTQQWLEKIVIGLNFCPFAARPYNERTIHYQVTSATAHYAALESLMHECNRLRDSPSIETTLLIFVDGYSDFNLYLDLVDLAEQLLKKERLEGVFQVASFHPAYRFAGEDTQDPANYTNRSPFPMLHILREEQLEQAIEKHKDIHSIPQKNIEKARKLGLDYFNTMNFGKHIETKKT